VRNSNLGNHRHTHIIAKQLADKLGGIDIARGALAALAKLL
jgi:hypothetical protein